MYTPMNTNNKPMQAQSQTPVLRNQFEKAVNNDLVRAKFREVLGKNAEAFVGSLLSLVKSNDLLLHYCGSRMFIWRYNSNKYICISIWKY